VGRGDVLVSTVGPFARFGEPALHAAVAAGAHYIDSTGEPPFVRTVFERFGPQAAAAGCTLVTAFGYDYVPGNLAGALALREAGERAVGVDIAYFVSGGATVSGGTRASAAGMIVEPSYAFRGGRIVAERAARRVRSIEGRPAIAVGGSYHYALPHVHPGLRDVAVWAGWFGPASRPLQALSAGTALATRLPGVRAAIGAATSRLVKGSTGGPDAAARARSKTHTIAIARDAAGATPATVRLQGINPYDFTAGMLAWGALRAAAGELRGVGALGPAGGFGLDELVAGAEQAGLGRSGVTPSR
jgi:short subunit dehydrogenase-like uncharacterized protein